MFSPNYFTYQSITIPQGTNIIPNQINKITSPQIVINNSPRFSYQ